MLQEISQMIQSDNFTISKLVTILKQGNAAEFSKNNVFNIKCIEKFAQHNKKQAKT